MSDKMRSVVLSVFGVGLVMFLVGCSNPVPILSSLIPNFRVYHMPAFTLTVKGSDFSSDSVIVFNGVQEQTTLVSSTEMTCQIDTNEIATAPASLPVLVRDTASGRESDTLFFTVEKTHTFSTPVQVSLALTVHDPIWPRITVDTEKNVSIVWGEGWPPGGYGYVYYIRSEDLGLTWINNIEIPEKNYYGNFFPSIAVDRSNNINVVYTKQTLNAVESYDLIFVRSTEGEGIHWTTPLNLTYGLAVWSKYTDIGIGMYNNSEQIALAFNSYMMTNTRNIFFISSDDSGQTWSSPVNVSKIVGYANEVSMALDTNGNIYMIWLEYSSLTNSYMYNIAFNLSHDFGASWGNSVLLTTGQVANKSPDIDVGELNRVYAAWIEQEDDLYPIVFISSQDGGVHWTTPVSLVNTVERARRPVVAADNAGNVYLYYFNDSGCFIRRSVDRGITWETPISIPIAQYGNGDIALDEEGNIYLTITDDDAIYFVYSQQ